MTTRSARGLRITICILCGRWTSMAAHAVCCSFWPSARTRSPVSSLTTRKRCSVCKYVPMALRAWMEAGSTAGAAGAVVPAGAGCAGTPGTATTSVSSPTISIVLTIVTSSGAKCAGDAASTRCGTAYRDLYGLLPVFLEAARPWRGGARCDAVSDASVPHHGRSPPAATGSLRPRHLDAPRLGGAGQGCVILLGLVRVGEGEPGDALIQRGTGASIAGDQRGVPGLGVRQGQRPAAEPAVGR